MHHNDDPFCRWSSTGWVRTTAEMGWLATTWPGPMCQTSGLPIGEGTLYICNNDDKTDKGKVMTLDQDLCNRHQGRLTKTTIRTSTLNSSDMTRTNVTDIKVAYRPNHTYACRFALLIMWSTFSGMRHCLMSSPTFSSVSYPTEFSKPLPTTPSQTTSYIFPTFPTTFLLYSNDNKANEWLCRKWKDSYHYLQLWINID